MNVWHVGKMDLGLAISVYESYHLKTLYGGRLFYLSKYQFIQLLNREFTSQYCHQSR